MPSSTTESDTTYEEAILETLTLPEEIKDWCKKNPKFLEALKVIVSNRFLHLGSVIHYPKDKILGIYSYDYQVLNPIFKQDFIEYSDITNPTFTLYTRNPKGSSKWVKDIKDFFKKFTDYNQGVSLHHLSLEQLPEILKERGAWAIKKGEELKKTGVRKLTKEELAEWLAEVKKVKQETNWYLYTPVE